MAKKVKVYNLEGKSTGEIELPGVFEIEPNEQLLSQYVRVYLANNRQGTRDTKDRSEVRGKAKKPYRQKGTGRARHGSMKAPSMKGGGVAHGPKPQNFSLKMPKAMRFRALLSAYAKKSDAVIVLEKAKMDEVKTKKVANFLNNAELNESVLIITNEVEKNLIMSARNVPAVKIITTAHVNAYDVLKFGKIVIEKEALKAMDHEEKVEEKAEVKKAPAKKVSKKEK